MRVAFFGTPEFALPTLDALADSDHEVVMVVSRPDKPKGRGRTLTPSPVKERAQALGYTVFQPPRLDAQAVAMLADIGFDAGVVVAYGLIIPKALLDLPRYGFVNVHPSLVPRHRGAAPVERALFEGDGVTGVSILKMGEGLDDGPVYRQESFEIAEEEDAAGLRERCSRQGARMMIDVLDALEQGKAAAIPQTEEGMTYAAKLSADEEWIRWEESADKIRYRVRALSPRPGASTLYHGKRLKVLAVERLSEEHSLSEHPGAVPGVIIESTKDGIVVTTGSEDLRILRVQPEGKTPMTGAEFARGYRPAVGDRLGELSGDARTDAAAGEAGAGV